MMNPQMMQQAQAMMANMTPEQMASMQQMVQNMSPEQRANMERMAQQQMGGGAGSAGASAAAPSGQAQYKLGGARMLKDEGNTLHKAGRHSEALAKYETAISNVSGLTSADAVELKTSCELNKAMCHLKLEQWEPCEQVCSAVLTRGPNLKAYYRRGQAHMGLLAWPAAAKDLKRALNMCPAGDAQADLISDKLTQSLDNCPEGADVSVDTPATKQHPKTYNDGSLVIEEVTDEPEMTNASTSSSTGAPVAPQGMGGTGSEYVAQMMQNDPDHARKMMEQMSELPPEEIQKMAAMAGMPGFDASTAKQMAEMMKHMPPEQMQEMAKVAERMHSSGATGAGQPSPGASGAAGQPPPMDPGMAADMLKNMSPEQLSSMTAAAKSSGMIPEGVTLDEEMIKMSASMMKNMKKEDLEQMQAMAGAARTAGGAGPMQSGAGMGPGGAAPPASMSEMLNNPEAMKSAMNMMKSMDTEGLKNMLKMSQPGMSDEAALKAAETMKNMDERVMGVVLKGAAGFQKAKSAANNAKDWLLARPAIMLALVVLVIACLLRLLGVM